MAYLPGIHDFYDSTDIDDSFSSSSLPMTEEKPIKAPGPVFPILPLAHNFSVLGNPERFQPYIRAEIPLACDEVAEDSTICPFPPPLTDKLQCDINTIFLNGLLKSPENVIEGPSDWVQQCVFRNDKLPIPFNQTAVVQDEKLWDSKSMTIPHPPSDMTEPQIRVWLNNIASNLAALHGIKEPSDNQFDRGFESRTAAKGPSGAYKFRKLDISVSEPADRHDSTRSQAERLHWHEIHATIEVTANSNASSALKHILRQITKKAAYIFDVQPQRMFFCAIGIFGEPTKLQFIFAIVDRAGVTHTSTAQINSYGTFTFLLAIFAFCFADLETLGWDMTMANDPETNELMSIAVTGCERDSMIPTTRTFSIVKLLHKSPFLFGRGTRVWIVKDCRGFFYVLKDSWVLAAADKFGSEIDFIKHVEKTINEDPAGKLYKYTCPTYYIGEGSVCSTDTIRGRLAPRTPTRLRRRIVTGPIGEPITSFRSKKEFVAVFLDLVNGLDFLNTKAKVIHGDLSINNILINRVWHYGPNDSPSQLRSLASDPTTANTSMPSDVSDMNIDDDAMSQLQPEYIVVDAFGQTSASHTLATSAPDVQVQAPTPAPAPIIGTVDYRGTLEPIEAAGMIIDYEFMQYVDQETHRTIGTLPFMAIEALMSTANNKFKHHSGHDLECVLNSMLTICHYTAGPGGKLREAIAGDENIKLNEWFSTANRVNLAATKTITLEAFNTFIRPALPEYWKDFAPFLHRLIQATWENMPFIEHRNVATHQAYRSILKEALDKYTLEETSPPAPYAFIPNAKRPHEEIQSFLSQFPPRRSVSDFLESFEESFE